MATHEPVSHIEVPSEPVTDTTRSIQKSTLPSDQTESIENAENKKLKEILNAVDALKSMPTLPAGSQIPSSPPPTPSASSLPEASQ
jgi:hypothetical protein